MLEWQTRTKNCVRSRLTTLQIHFAGDLLVRDCFGATAVDYIHNKQLNYCRMVIRAHSQHNDKHTGKAAFVSTPSSPDR